MPLYLALSIGALVAIVIVLVAMPTRVDRSRRAEIPPSQWPQRPPAYDSNQDAIQQIHEDRRKRSEARALAQRDPQMASELRVGRPDLPRQYDDGGLVDVNSVPAATLTEVLGLSPSVAGHVVEVRQQLGGFTHVDDLVNLAGVELSTFDRVKDRLILL